MKYNNYILAKAKKSGKGILPPPTMFCNCLKASCLKTLLAALMLTVSLSTNALTWTDPDTGIKWTYTKLADGTASLGGGKTTSTAVPKNTKGDLVVPEKINGLDVTEIKTYAFYECYALTSITLPKVKTTTNAKGIFQNCQVLKNINLQNIDVSKATTLSKIFEGCILSEISGVANWDVSNVTDISYMFYLNRDLNVNNKITDLSPLANWDVSKVTNMEGTFGYLRKIKNLNGLENWDVSNVTNMKKTFSNCNAITNISSIANWNVSNVTDMSYMFEGYISITSLTPLSNWNVSSVTNMLGMFYGTDAFDELKNLNGLENWDVSNVTNMQAMFYGHCNLKDISALTNWNVGKVTDMSLMFCSYGGNRWGTIQSLVSLENWDVSNVTNMSQMFDRQQIITNLSGLEKWDVKKVTSMFKMFGDCVSLIDISALVNWDVSNVTNMSSMFSECHKLIYADISKWCFNNDINCYGLFSNCYELKRITLPINGFNKSGGRMYNGCVSLEETTIPSNVNLISEYTFFKCSKLKAVTIPSKVQSIEQYAFSYQMTSLQSVFCMATTPPTLDPTAFDSEDGTTTGKINKTLYVKTSALEAYQADPQWSRFAVITDQIPFTIAAGKQYSTLAVDFDADFSETTGVAPYIAASYYEGRTAAAKVAQAYQRAGMPAKAKAAAEDNTIRTIVVAQFTDKYIPSRTGDDNFTFHGALIYGKPGTYYYKMGERDYASGNQVTEDWENNYMMPAYETWQLSPTYTQEPENWMCYPKDDSYNFVLKDGRFRYIDNQGSIPRYKAWLSLPAEIVSGTYQEAGAKMTITFDDGDTGDTETTGITFITEQKDRDGNVTYNLAGQQVDDAYKGMVIRNGKTFIKK